KPRYRAFSEGFFRSRPVSRKVGRVSAAPLTRNSAATARSQWAVRRAGVLLPAGARELRLFERALMRAVPNLAVRRRGALFAGVASVLAVLVVATAGAAAGGARAAGPQGTLVFASDRSGRFQIYSIRADGSRLGQLTRGRAADAAPLFSPDGRLIVFNRARKHDASELWVMSADGSGQRKLASSGSAPAWSPDSRRIAYI